MGLKPCKVQSQGRVVSDVVAKVCRRGQQDRGHVEVVQVCGHGLVQAVSADEGFHEVSDGTGSAAAPADSTSAAPTPTDLAPAVVVATAPAAAPLPGSRTGLRRTGVVKSSPLARKIARELQVDIGAVVGTGPDGRITKRDVEAAHSAEPAVSADIATPSPDTSVPAVHQVSSFGEYEEAALTNIQRLSATRLTESMQQAPHFYVTSAIDVTDLFAFRAQINATLDLGKVSVNDLLVKAVAVALRKDGSINVSFAGDKLLRHKQIHIGVAAATPMGLLVPVIRDADRKSVSEIATESREKATRARDRKLRAEEMSGGTFTISNLGMFGIEQFTAVINSPESAILAVGAAADELRLDNDEVVARRILRVTLSADHRAIDGAVAAQFLATLKELVENPLRIVA
ncbi:dihydrolipoamide acetyltransferase family protein [Nocardia sp. NPDC058658]|uniref:dihydrolipoamide acetyltransferase family protein n=1 Tax=Nocardia sp. NPDC058658 TaxID=3346580 RepID=UPI003663E35C